MTKWTDLSRALSAAWWALSHADDLALLKENLENENFGWNSMTREQAARLRRGQARRFLGTFPLKRKGK